jgi:hypothetical protein
MVMTPSEVSGLVTPKPSNDSAVWATRVALGSDGGPPGKEHCDDPNDGTGGRADAGMDSATRGVGVAEAEPRTPIVMAARLTALHLQVASLRADVTASPRQDASGGGRPSVIGGQGQRGDTD